MGKVIGVVGSRRRNSFDDYVLVYNKFFELYEPGDRICSGLCKQGADNFALYISEVFKIEPLWFSADWKTHGKAAGFIRNTDIAKSSNILISCVAHDRTGGTEDTIKKFVKEKGDKNLILV